MLLAVDWGTSSLRGALLEDDGRVLQERSAPRGILTVEPGSFRLVFDDTFGDWHAKVKLTLLSGMAGGAGRDGRKRRMCHARPASRRLPRNCIGSNRAASRSSPASAARRTACPT